MIKVHLGSIIYFVCVHDSTTLQHFFIFWISRCGKNVALLRDSAHVRGRNFCCSWHSLAHYYIVPRISGGNIKSHEAVKGGIKASINCLDYFLVHDISLLLYKYTMVNILFYQIDIVFILSKKWNCNLNEWFIFKWYLCMKHGQVNQA